MVAILTSLQYAVSLLFIEVQLLLVMLHYSRVLLISRHSALRRALPTLHSPPLSTRVVFIQRRTRRTSFISFRKPPHALRAAKRISDVSMLPTTLLRRAHFTILHDQPRVRSYLLTTMFYLNTVALGVALLMFPVEMVIPSTRPIRLTARGVSQTISNVVLGSFAVNAAETSDIFVIVRSNFFDFFTFRGDTTNNTTRRHR